MMRVTFDDLPTIALFARVVELRSFTAAADEAGLAKASVSQRIGRLEARLGVQLLRRSTRKLSVTEDGARLFEHAASLVDLAREADDALAAGATLRGRVKLNAPASIHRGTLTEALRSFLARHPALTLQVTLEDRLVDLVEGDFDVLLRVVPPRQRTSIARRLGSDTMVVVGAPSYLDSAPPLVTPYDLVQHACLRNSAIPARTDWRLEASGRRYAVPVRSRFECADFALLHAAALSGLGLLVTLRGTVEDDLSAGRLRQVLDRYTAEPLGIYALLAERTRKNNAARALVEHLARTFRSGPS
jgi:DNA-binding transcriptional LysR family regulator